MERYSWVFRAIHRLNLLEKTVVSSLETVLLQLKGVNNAMVSEMHCHNGNIVASKTSGWTGIERLKFIN